MSAYSGALPDHNGRFRRERLDAAFDSPGWLAYRLSLGSNPVGLAVVRGLGRYVLAAAAEGGDDSPGAGALIRPAASDMFREGSAEAYARGFRDGSADASAREVR